MTCRILIFLSLTCIIICTLAQKGPEPANADRKIDSLYRNKNYEQAARGYIDLANHADFQIKKNRSYYQAAICYSLLNKKDSAFLYLSKSIAEGYNDKKNLLEDSGLNALRNDERWKENIAKLKESKKKVNTDPRKARIIISDINNFWTAYDKAVRDTAHFKSIFKTYYFGQASAGMQDYMGLKVRNIDAFIYHVKSLPEFYKAIRNNTYAPSRTKNDLVKSFEQLKSIYPDALFPDVYFIIGSFTSAGTVSDNGLLIGINQFCDDESIPKEELNARTRRMFVSKELFPGLVPHELTHFQQQNMKRDTTTLCYAIVEGMADFIGEKISGVNANNKLHHWAAGKEKVIWAKFSIDMYYNRYNRWIANAQGSSPDNPADQGYWVGYQICKAYYTKASDKNKAIKEMLNIQDYPKFLKDSGWEQNLTGL
jgi:hypothetical protein